VDPPPKGTAALGFYPDLAPGICLRVVRRRTAESDDPPPLVSGAYTCYTWPDYPPIPVPAPVFWCPLPADPPRRGL
jgi:hypothetical protein